MVTETECRERKRQW